MLGFGLQEPALLELPDAGGSGESLGTVVPAERSG